MFSIESAKSYWAIQVLTLDYLITGYMDADRDKTSFRMAGHDAGSLAVLSAQLQPSGNLDVPVRAPIPWVLVYGDEMVALIPRDEAGNNAAIQTNGSYFKIPIPAEVFVGHYRIRGKVMASDPSLRVFTINMGFPVQDAEIDCLLPGAPLKGLKVPYLLVMSRQKQLVVPAVG